MEMRTIEDMRRDIIENGFELQDSHEAFFKYIAFEEPLDELFIDMGTDMHTALKVIELATFASKFPGSAPNVSSAKVGAYKIKDYVGIMAQLDEIKHKVSDARFDIDSRKLTILFGKEHCFVSIHFLIRDGAVLVSSIMRSCNLEVNFLIDAYISYYCGREIANVLGIDRVELYMLVNSLHVMKAGIN